MSVEILVPIGDVLRARLFNAEDWARLSALGHVQVLADARYDEAGSRAALARADVVVTGWGTQRLDGPLLAEAPALRAVVHTGGSVRSIVGPEAFEREIVVSSQTAANAQPVAEFSLAMILLAGKDSFRAQRLYAQTRSFIDREEYFPSAGLYQRQVGLVGLSRISRRLIELLRPFDLDVAVYSRHLGEDEAARLGVRGLGLDELLSTSDVISLHSASLPSTRHMIGARELSLIRHGATLLNTARGAIVDQSALIAELATGRFDAILDVADPDVTVPDSPLWDMPNVILTPHFAGAVGTELMRLGHAAVQDVATVLSGEQPAGAISATQYEAQA